MDWRSLEYHLSTERAVFVDMRMRKSPVSMNKAYLVDERWFLRCMSIERRVFMDRSV